MENHFGLPAKLLALLPDPLLSLAEPRALERGARLFEQDSAPHYMFYVVSGEVALERCGEHGERIVLQRVCNGPLAEASLQAARYHCDAIVARSGTAIALPLKTLRAALQDDAHFAMRWIAMLNSEIRTLRLRCERLSLKGVEARLLHLIESEGENGRYRVGSTLKHLALELGVSHEALYRELSRLERSGQVIRSEGELILRR